MHRVKGKDESRSASVQNSNATPYGPIVAAYCDPNSAAAY